jgi:hypothetical protein
MKPSGNDTVDGKVTVAELVEHGLGNHPPNVVGVAFPDVNDAVAVLCRFHVDARALRRLGIGHEHSTAVLLIGGTETEHALSVWCAGCQSSANGTR